MNAPRAVRGGFTLLEVVVAITILAAGVVGLMTLLRGSLSLSGGARDVTTATLFASQRLEEALLLPTPASESSGEFTEGGKYRWRLSAEPLPADEAVPVEGERFHVTVSWDEGDAARSVDLSAERWRRKAGSGG